MKIISAIKNAFRYSIFDDLVDTGAEKLDRFPEDVLWLDEPSLIWIGDYAIESDALVGAKDDSIVISKKNGRHAVAIKIKNLKRDSDSIDRHRPFALRGLRVSFGERADRYVAERLITQEQEAEQAAP